MHLRENVIEFLTSKRTNISIRLSVHSHLLKSYVNILNLTAIKPCHLSQFADNSRLVFHQHTPFREEIIYTTISMYTELQNMSFI